MAQQQRPLTLTGDSTLETGALRHEPPQPFHVVLTHISVLFTDGGTKLSEGEPVFLRLQTNRFLAVTRKTIPEPLLITELPRGGRNGASRKKFSTDDDFARDAVGYPHVAWSGGWMIPVSENFGGDTEMKMEPEGAAAKKPKPGLDKRIIPTVLTIDITAAQKFTVGKVLASVPLALLPMGAAEPPCHLRVPFSFGCLLLTLKPPNVTPLPSPLPQPLPAETLVSLGSEIPLSPSPVSSPLTPSTLDHPFPPSSASSQALAAVPTSAIFGSPPLPTTTGPSKRPTTSHRLVRCLFPWYHARQPTTASPATSYRAQ